MRLKSKQETHFYTIFQVTVHETKFCGVKFPTLGTFQTFQTLESFGFWIFRLGMFNLHQEETMKLEGGSCHMTPHKSR